MQYSIILDKVSKKYQIGQPRQIKMLQETIMNWSKTLFRNNGAASEVLWALKDISLTIRKGEVVGIIGHNGAGKSTLLKVLSRITYPTSGTVKVNGRVASLLEVGTGFHDELTGRENVMLNASILGMKKSEVLAKLDDIVAFAGVERFIDTPIKRYSSGMRLRLGFAVAAHLDPDILIIDEVLAVGDAGFQKKCLRAMDDLRTAGRTVLFVSHNLAAVENLCSRVIWIQNGEIREDGEPQTVIHNYMNAFASEQGSSFDLRSIKQRRGNGDVIYTRCEFLDYDRNPIKVIRSGDRFVMRLSYQASSHVPHPVFAISLYTELGTLVTQISSWAMDYEIPFVDKGEGYIDLEIDLLNLMPGRYYLSLLLGSVGPIYFDILDHYGILEVEPSDIYRSGKGIDSRYGIMFVTGRWSLNGCKLEKAPESKPSRIE